MLEFFDKYDLKYIELINTEKYWYKKNLDTNFQKKMWAEKKVEDWIREYVEIMGWVCKKIHSGEIYKKYGAKTYKIQLEMNGTTDYVIDFKWTCYWTEIKKDKKEYDDWLKIEERFYWIWKPLPKKQPWKKLGYQREIDQITEKKKILNRWSNYILTYSLKDFINKIWDYDSYLQELKKT